MQVIKYAPAMDLMDGDGFMVNPSMGEVDKVMEDMRERGFDRKPQKEYSFKEIVEIGATGPHFVFGQGTKEYQNAMAAFLTGLHDQKFAIFDKKNFLKYEECIKTNLDEDEDEGEDDEFSETAFEKKGEKIYTTDVVVERVEFVPGAGGGSSAEPKDPEGQNDSSGNGWGIGVTMDDIPF